MFPRGGESNDLFLNKLFDFPTGWHSGNFPNKKPSIEIEQEFPENWCRCKKINIIYFRDFGKIFGVLGNFGIISFNPPLLILPPPIQFCTPFIKIRAQVPPFGLHPKFSTPPSP